MSEPSPTPSNPRYGRYEVLFRIAAGGMAEVYVARLLGEGGFEKLVALKRMLPTLAEDERFVGMFLDEGRVAANISSPHVVSTLDLGRAEDDSLYLVMELVVGVSLSALLKVAQKAGEIIPLDVAVELLAQAALGLEDAHEARTIYGEPLGIVHRDISPQNVLIDVGGRVRITDFGVARALERVTQTQSGEVKGKLAYFAPEQARAKPLDRRADVYALGIVGWELITGRRLFAGEGPADTLMKVLEMQAPLITDFRPEAPPELAFAIAGALTRNLEERTPTAGQFAAELRAAMPGSGAPALGRYVRARGGESLLRLEEGIRGLVPSSASGRLIGTGSGTGQLGRSTGSRPIVKDVVKDPVKDLPPAEEATTRTPSVSRVLERSAVPAAVPPPIEVVIEPSMVAPAAAPPPAQPMPFAPMPVPVAAAAPEPSSRGKMFIGAAVLLLLVGVGVGIGSTLALPATDAAPPASTSLVAPAVPSVEGLPAAVSPPAVSPTEVAPTEAMAEVAPTEAMAEVAPTEGVAEGTPAEVAGELAESDEVIEDAAGRPVRRPSRRPVRGASGPTTTAAGSTAAGGAGGAGSSSGSSSGSSGSASTGSGASTGRGAGDRLRGMDDFESELGGH